MFLGEGRTTVCLWSRQHTKVYAQGRWLMESWCCTQGGYNPRRSVPGIRIILISQDNRSSVDSLLYQGLDAWRSSTGWSGTEGSRKLCRPRNGEMAWPWYTRNIHFAWYSLHAEYLLMFIAKMGQSESYVVYVIPWERGRKVLIVCLFEFVVKTRWSWKFVVWVSLFGVRWPTVYWFVVYCYWHKSVCQLDISVLLLLLLYGPLKMYCMMMMVHHRNALGPRRHGQWCVRVLVASSNGKQNTF